MVNAAIAEALAARRPVMVEAYARQARRVIEGLAERWTWTFKGIYNSRDAGRFQAYAGVLRPVAGQPYSSSSTKEIDEERLQRWAEENADAAIATWVAKIDRKIGACTDVEVSRGTADLLSFTINARWNGRTVHLQQSPVFKVSPRGMPFYQFPARIYVDGEFTPEAKFEAMVKEAAA